MLFKLVLPCLIVIVVAATFLNPLPNREESQAPKVSELRDEWDRGLRQGYQVVNSAYLDDLFQLEKRLLKSNQTADLATLTAEIQLIKENERENSLDPKVRIHQWHDRSSLPGIRFARTISERRMAEMLKRKNATYRRALIKLREKSAENDQDAILPIIDRALEELAATERLASEKEAPLASSQP